jgi:hypothetical protein
VVAELAALPVFAWLVTYALHSTLLLGAAWLLTRRLDARALGLRERVWKFAVLGGFATAALQVGSGVEPLLGRVELALAADQAPRDAAQPAAAEAAEQSTRAARIDAALAAIESEPRSAPRAAAPSAAHDAAAALELEPAPALLGTTQRGLSPAQPAAERHAPLAPQVSRRRAQAAGPRAAVAVDGGLPLVALGGWLLAGLASAGLVTFGLSRLRRELAGAVELHDGDAVEMLERLTARAELARPVRLIVAPRLAAPLSTGWRNPRICLPPRALDELSREELEAVLAHEVAHLARRDPPWLFLLWLIETVCFFQPLNRLARRELSASFELSADAWAARATGDRLALAACLARIAGWIVGAPAPRAQRALGAAMADALDGDRPRSRLGVRILRLLDPAELARDERPARAELPLGLALLGALALAVPGAAAQEPQLAEDPSKTLLSPLSPAPPPAPLHPAAPPAPAPRSPDIAPAALDASPGDAAGEDFFEGLDTEMDALAEELELLRAELSGPESDPRWSAALEGLEQRSLRLEDRRRRMQVVLDALLAEQGEHDARRFGP